MSKYHIALDLEMMQPSQNIIEIGLAVGCPETRTVVATQSFFVNPNEVLSEYIMTLTSIKQIDVDMARPLKEVFQTQVIPYLQQYPIKYPMIAWGAGDGRALKQQVSDESTTILGWTEMNVKNLCQAICESQSIKLQGSLSTMMTKFGLQFSGTKHRAVDDAKNTLILYYTLLDKLQCVKLK